MQEILTKFKKIHRLKKLILLISSLVLIVASVNSCNKLKDNYTGKTDVNKEDAVSNIASQTSKITDESSIKFDEEIYDFKQIKKGDEVTHIFKFTNVGKKPLIISEVRPSCGCTTPKYTKTPVAPGKKGSITVTFDSSNFDGAVLKTVTVGGNFETKIIKFQADIIN